MQKVSLTFSMRARTERVSTNFDPCSALAWFPERYFDIWRPTPQSELLHDRTARTWEATDNSRILNSKKQCAFNESSACRWSTPHHRPEEKSKKGEMKENHRLSRTAKFCGCRMWASIFVCGCGRYMISCPRIRAIRADTWAGNHTYHEHYAVGVQLHIIFAGSKKLFEPWHWQPVGSRLRTLDSISTVICTCRDSDSEHSLSSV